MAPQNNKPKPVTTLRCSSIQASIWKNEGEKGPFYNVTVARSYKGPDGAWKNSESDLPLISWTPGYATAALASYSAGA